jgi:hypothetical protein
MKPLQLTRGCALMEATREQWGIFVKYTGPDLESLLAAKCITPAMYRAFGKPCPGVRRRDVDGDAIRKVQKRGKVEVELYISHSEHKALRLAGVRQSLVDESKPVMTEPEALAALATGKRKQALAALASAACIEDGGLRKKQRTVGRFQRLVEYATVGNLVIPNWSALVRERLAG